MRHQYVVAYLRNNELRFIAAMDLNDAEGISLRLLVNHNIASTIL
jgi:hypothetical protein